MRDQAIIESMGIRASIKGDGEDRSLDRAIPRQEAIELRRALEAEGYETSDAPDHDDPHMRWVYIAPSDEVC